VITYLVAPTSSQSSSTWAIGLGLAGLFSALSVQVIRFLQMSG
jgi:hypothetical protein